MEAVQVRPAPAAGLSVRRPSSQEFPTPSILNLTLVLVQIASALVLLYTAAHTRSAALFGVSLGLFAFVMQFGFCLIHEAEHDKLNDSRTLNEALGILLSALFPASYHFLKVAHLTHHVRNRTDAELVDYIRTSENPWLKRVQYYLLICGLFWLLVPLTSLVICFLPGSLLRRRTGNTGIFVLFAQLLASVRLSRVRAEVAFTILLWIALVRGLGLRAGPLAACYLAFAFFWANQQYIYHVRTRRHRVEGAFDLRIWRPLQLLYLNFNYHLTHHRDTSVPWLHLPKVALEQPTRGYLSTYLRLWIPPQPIAQAPPPEFAASGLSMAETPR